MNYTFDVKTLIFKIKEEPYVIYVISSQQN